MKHLFLFLGLFYWGLASAQVNTRQTKEQYIEKYKTIAISEMIRTGVPASITLAQGILESSSGNSQLATEAKNHFGIKCHKDWKGPKMYMDDDTIGECFRVYGSAEESFTDHSNFLRTRPRYAFLFDLNKTDYRSWALGLKKAGYATNPNYAQLLIDLIEKLQLMQYDLVDENGLKNLVQHSKPIPKQHLDEKVVKQIIKYNEIDAYAVQKNDEGPLSVAVLDDALADLQIQRFAQRKILVRARRSGVFETQTKKSSNTLPQSRCNGNLMANFSAARHSVEFAAKKEPLGRRTRTGGRNHPFPAEKNR